MMKMIITVEFILINYVIKIIKLLESTLMRNQSMNELFINEIDRRIIKEEIS